MRIVAIAGHFRTACPKRLPRGAAGAGAARTNDDEAMRRSTIAAVALFSACAVPAVAEPVQTPGSNVTVTTCHAQLDPPPLRIAYVNTSSLTATEVDFEINTTAGTIQSVVDRGHFEKGSPINHVFALPPNTSPLGLSSPKCVVTKVVYADGTSWVNPANR